MPAPTDFQEAADYPTTDYPADDPADGPGLDAWEDDAVRQGARDPGRAARAGWTYNTNVAYPASPDGVAEFLTAREGFCQQYATAMALLLRSINIPARVVIGFTAGTPDQNDATLFHVSTSDIHSWVEVPFGQYGWLTFEPTPGAQFVDPSTSGYLTRRRPVRSPARTATAVHPGRRAALPPPPTPTTGPEAASAPAGHEARGRRDPGAVSGGRTARRTPSCSA